MVLAQSTERLQRDAGRATEEATRWLTENPLGQLVGVAVVAAVTVVALLVLFRTSRWAAARWKAFAAVAVALAAGYVGVVYLMDLGPTGWLVAGFVAFSLFLGFALFSTRGGSRR